MKLNKKIALVLIAVFMLTIVAGCGAKPAAPTASQSNEILIGLNYELTGDVASYGVSASNAIQMAFDEINAKGGVLGKKLKVVKYDNKSDPSEATNIATKLATKDKVAVILGPATSGNCFAAAPVATQYKIPEITNSGTNAKVTVDEKTGKTKEFMFRTCFIDPFQGTTAAKFASNTLKAKTAALLIENSSDYAKGLSEVFEKTFTANGGKIVAREAFVKGDTDFRATLTKLTAAKPDLIYVPSYYQDDAVIAKQAREMEYTNPILGGDGWDSPELLKVAGAEALQNVYFTNHYSANDTDPKVVKFVSDYKAKYGNVPDSFTATAYDMAYMVYDAITRAGSADSVQIKDALAATKDFVGVTGKITMDAQHNPIKGAAVLSFDQAGNQKFVEKINP